jgi:hypothetical protein
MAAFDPDAYLANKQAPGFDPDAYLNARPAPAPKAPPSMSFGDYAADMARSIPGGLAKGVAGTLGMVGDFGNPSQYETVEGSGGEQITVNKGANRQGFPTSQQLNKAFSSPTGGYYQPKTTAGEYTEAVAEFAPGVFGGPGSLARRALTTAGSAIGSETLGRVTKDTALETPARIAGALLGHKVSSQGHRLATTGSMSNLRDAERVTASTKAMKTEADALFNDARNAGFELSPDSFKNFKQKLLLLKKKEGITPELTQKAAGLTKLIIGKPSSISLSELHDLRKVASDATSVLDKTDRRAARLILDQIDDYMATMKPVDVMSGDPTNAVRFLGEAKTLWRKASQGEVIEKTIAKAKDRSGPALNNFDSQARKEFNKLRNNERGFNRLDPEVQAAVTSVAKGSGLGQNLAYGLGSLVPATSTTGGIATGAGLVAGAVNPYLLTALIPAVPAKLFSAAKTGKAARTASVLARGGKIEPSAPLFTREKALAAALSARPNYEDIP